MATLLGGEGERFELVGDAVTVGRDPVHGIALLGDKRVSRTHAELHRRDGQWLLVDVGSRNGTEVNGRPVKRHPLRDGDRVRVGGTVLTYVAGVDDNATEVDQTPDPLPGHRISDRERQVLDLVAEGLTDRAIGERLFISVSTVRSHLDRIREKSGLHRRSELTRLAIELGRTD